MTHKALIRSETSVDVSTIAEVTVAAFKTLAISNQTEQFIIAALRAAKALAVSLAAEVDRRVVGHIAFSPVTMSDGSRTGMDLNLCRYCRNTREVGLAVRHPRSTGRTPPFSPSQ